MSYRFLLDDKGWRVFVSTAIIQTPTFSDVRIGAIGVDLNVGFVSLSQTDRFGNIEVSAAYSSKIGAQKYARRYGLSGHRAAGLVLARRAQRFPDRLKPSSRKRFATTCKDRREPVPARLKGKGGRGKARLETYSQPPRGRSRPLLVDESDRRRKRREFAVRLRGVISTPVRVRV
jgi:hypothetical protein